MSIPSNHIPPEEPKFPIITPGMYPVEILDIDLDRKPNTFKKSDDDGQPEEREQYKVKFKLTGPADLAGRQISAWINTSLRVSTRSKRPGLVKFLKAVTGQDFTPGDREKVTGDFMNSLIGSTLSITIDIEKKKNGDDFNPVTGFFKSNP